MRMWIDGETINSYIMTYTVFFGFMHVHLYVFEISVYAHLCVCTVAFESSAKVYRIGNCHFTVQNKLSVTVRQLHRRYTIYGIRSHLYRCTIFIEGNSLRINIIDIQFDSVVFCSILARIFLNPFLPVDLSLWNKLSNFY